MQLGLVTRTCWCLYFCRFFCVLDSFLKGHSLIIPQHRLLHSVITSLMWNSGFACVEIHCNSLQKVVLNKDERKIYEKQSWRKKTNIKENALKGRREEWRLRKKIKKLEKCNSHKMCLLLCCIYIQECVRFKKQGKNIMLHFKYHHSFWNGWVKSVRICMMVFGAAASSLIGSAKCKSMFFRVHELFCFHLCAGVTFPPVFLSNDLGDSLLN